MLPTTPSTAYGKAGTAVTVPGSAERLALFDPKTRAASLVLVAEALATAPGDLVRNAGLTTMVMAAEGMTTRKANLFSDAVLGQALSILVQDLTAAREAIRPAARANRPACGRRWLPCWSVLEPT